MRRPGACTNIGLLTILTYRTMFCRSYSAAIASRFGNCCTHGDLMVAVVALFSKHGKDGKDGVVQSFWYIWYYWNLL